MSASSTDFSIIALSCSKTRNQLINSKEGNENNIASPPFHFILNTYNFFTFCELRIHCFPTETFCKSLSTVSMTEASHNVGYGSIATEENKAAAMAAGKVLMTEAVAKYEELKLYAEEGQWTWKVAGFFAGLLIVSSSLFSIISHFFDLSPFAVLMDIYMMMFGSVACALEYKDVLLTASARSYIRREALFLYRPYGRAAFYFFVGLLQIAQGGVIGTVVGLYTTIVGIIIYSASKKALLTLETVRTSLKTEREVAAQFARFDTDNNGCLDASELAKLCQALGATQSLNELESALFILDVNADGKISYEEFLDWWSGRADNMV